MREITCVSVDLTTHCDRRCPDCCCGIGINRILQHHPWEYFERLATVIYGIERVNLTGGEPTLHPHFAEFVPRFKALFGCQRLTLSTDGFRVDRYRQLIDQCFDEVHFSDYETRPTALVALRGASPLLSVYDAGADAVNFTPRSRRGNGLPCVRGFSETVAYADGKFFGCCVGPGIDGAEGLEPSTDWRQRIVTEPLPCGDCWFSL